MEMSTLNPLAPILLTTIVSVLAGYYIGKTAGLRAAGRAYQLAEKVAAQQEKDKKEQEKAKVVGGGSEEDWESEDDGDEVEVADIKKFEDSHEPCKMVSPPLFLFLFQLDGIFFWPKPITNA